MVKQSTNRQWPVEVCQLNAAEERDFSQAVIDSLKERGCSAIFVEGGGRTVSSFLQWGLLDRLQIAVAPLIIGSGIPAISLPPLDKLEGALRPPCRTFDMGHDILFDLVLRD